MFTMQLHSFTAHIERDNETGYFIGSFPSVPAAFTQATSLDELQIRLKEVLELCIEEMNDEEKNSLPEFIGVQQVSLTI